MPGLTHHAGALLGRYTPPAPPTPPSIVSVVAADGRAVTAGTRGSGNLLLGISTNRPSTGGETAAGYANLANVNGATGRHANSYRRTATNTSGDDLTWDVAAGTNNSPKTALWAIAKGSYPTLAVADIFVQPTGASITAPSLTVPVGGGYDLLFVSDGGASWPGTPPSGFTTLANSTVAYNVGGLAGPGVTAFIRPVSAGATGTTSITTAGSGIGDQAVLRVVLTA